MLVGERIPEHRADVDAALVGERALSDERRAVGEAQVRHVGDVVGETSQLRDVLPADDCVPQLEFEVANRRDQIAVSASLPVTVHRALHVRHAKLYGGDGVGDGQLGVVVGMDADHAAKMLAHVRHDLGQARRQRAAVGVAEHEAVRAGVKSSLERAEGKVPARLVAVEEVLGIVDHLAAERLEVGDRGADHLQVLLLGHAQGALGVQAPALAEYCHGWRGGLDQHPNVGVLFDGVRDVACGAEGDEPGPPQFEIRLGALEEFGVSRVRAGPAALDIVNSESVQLARDRQLVCDREGDILALRAISKRRVVDEYPHRTPPAPPSRSRKERAASSQASPSEGTASWPAACRRPLR